MADSSGQAEIRGLYVDKLVKGFADEDLIITRYVTVSTTSAREIRWYQKTSGFLDSADTTSITTSQIANTAFRSRPVVVEQSWTRRTSYVKKYFVESPLMSVEDINDTDVDILATNIRDLVRAVGYQKENRIINVLTESYSPSNINTAAATGTGWDDTTNGNPVLDILTGKKNIRSYGYNPEGAVLLINSIEHLNLINFLITVKGSSIPSFSSERVRDGVVMELLGCQVVVSENIATDYALLFVPERACTWKSFVPITSSVIDDPGIGKKIRVWEEGEALLTDPRAVHLITDTVT